MLPSPTAFKANEVIARTSSQTYTIADMDDFIRNVGFPRGVPMRAHISNSSLLMSKAPGVPVFCFHGQKEKSTIDEVVFGAGGFPDNPSHVELGDGDGTVNAASLRLCGSFADMQSERVEVKEHVGVDHNGVLTNSTVFEQIAKLLK